MALTALKPFTATLANSSVKKKEELKLFLEEKYRQYNKDFFIETDPVSIPHLFNERKDIEIAGFLTATIAWGQRPVILRNARELLIRMDNRPADFISSFTEADLKSFRSFKHRTFNYEDLILFLKSLKRLYRKYPSPEELLLEKITPNDIHLKSAISNWRKEFFKSVTEGRSGKHFSDPERGSAAKRINMFLRWMIRKDEFGVDFGLWSKISPALLICPLDVHSGRVGRKLGLLKRRADDWKAAEELTDSLKKFDPADPVKYDFALFGLGVFERF